MILIFDTETTGLPKNYQAPVSDSDNWPRVVQIAWQLHDFDGTLIEHASLIIKPEGYTIPFEAEKIHGISNERAHKEGIPLREAMEKFRLVIERTIYYAGHNLEFDLSILGAEWYRLQLGPFPQKTVLDTKSEAVTEFCALPGGKGGKYKWPTLGELYQKLFGTSFEQAHNAAFDIAANGRALFELIKMGIVAVPECEKILTERPIRYQNPDLTALLEHEKKWQHLKSEESQKVTGKEKKTYGSIEDFPLFNSLHNHSQFSILQSTSTLEGLVSKSSELGSNALALTDEGNMYGCFLFGQEIEKYNKKAREYNARLDESGSPEPRKPLLKPIFGSQIRICKNHKDKSVKDDGYLTVFLAKNTEGYRNLSKLSSISLTEGFYYVPRIDKEVLLKYKEGLIVLSGWLSGEIPSLILHVGEEAAEKALLWYLEHFGENFYLEIHRHGLPEEEAVNKVLIKFSRNYNIPLVAAHQNYYLEPNDHVVHDMLLCIRDGVKVNTPVGRGKGYRYGLPNQNFFFPTKKYVYEHFRDIPEAVENTMRIAEKVESFSLNRDVLLPRFDIPEDFIRQLGLPDDDPEFHKKAENLYLRHLTYEGAKKRYLELTQEITDRIDFELQTIERMGYPGYFLIVQDFTSKAREMGVLVGPGRGSAAGSVIAYCLGITNIDPISYKLLFERFLNPDRVSMPDIDIDFDDDGREKVLQYVVEKYGKDRVAQIITYGTLGGKSAIRDAARVLDYSIEMADRTAKAFPQIPDAELKKLIQPEGIDPKILESIKERPELLEQSQHFRKIALQDTPDGKLIRMAAQLEGCLRNSGVHACGVIITPGELTQYVPVTRPKEGNMLLTQFDNSVAENAGLLKMDFLGLKTLTIIRDALRFIEDLHGIRIDIDRIPLDDQKTYELFQKGHTNGIFQFESPGMQKYLKELKPDALTDLIAMNALYRPGPLQYIPNFIRRKHGLEPVTYPLPAMEEYLKETYGVTVYQEQVMLLAQKLAGFSKGDADTLRKAMGKKQKDTLAKMKDKFIKGCKENGHPLEVCEKIWKDWEAFASYAFNKSHSTCYAYLAYQTAYLKAHYPAEFLASVLNHQKDIENISFFLEECQRLGIKVLGPDVNESGIKFMVTPNGNIRFGMSGIKGVGENLVELIVDERKKNGAYKSVFDFARRHDTKVVNKKVLENLSQAGAFDSMGIKRSMFFLSGNSDLNLTDLLIRYCNQNLKNKNNLSLSLFENNDSKDTSPSEPSLPEAEEWPLGEKLKREKELVGFYLSGHPLNPWSWILKYVCTAQFSDLKKRMTDFKDKEILVAGIVEQVESRTGKTGNPYLKVTMFDKSEDPLELIIAGKDYLNFQHFFKPDMRLFLKMKLQTSFDGNTWRYSILSIDLLDEMENKIQKHLKISIPLQNFTKGVSERLNEILKKYSGKSTYEICIIDNVSRKEFCLLQRQSSLSLNQDLITELENLGGIELKII